MWSYTGLANSPLVAAVWSDFVEKDSSKEVRISGTQTNNKNKLPGSTSILRSALLRVGLCPCGRDGRTAEAPSLSIFGFGRNRSSWPMCLVTGLALGSVIDILGISMTLWFFAWAGSAKKDDVLAGSAHTGNGWMRDVVVLKHVNGMTVAVFAVWNLEEQSKPQQNW